MKTLLIFLSTVLILSFTSCDKENEIKPSTAIEKPAAETMNTTSGWIKSFTGLEGKDSLTFDEFATVVTVALIESPAGTAFADTMASMNKAIAILESKVTKRPIKIENQIAIVSRISADLTTTASYTDTQAQTVTTAGTTTISYINGIEKIHWESTDGNYQYNKENGKITIGSSDMSGVTSGARQFIIELVESPATITTYEQ